MSSRVLLTTARAPSCFAMAGTFHAAGHEVYLADCLRHPAARYSNRVAGYLEHRAPASDAAGYIEDLKRFIAEKNIDLLLPTCEDIFYIAPHRHDMGCDVFCDDLDKLHSFHHKYRFTEVVQDLGITIPETHLLESRRDIGWFEEVAEDWVFKPAYSRFATHTLVGPTSRELRHIKPTPEWPWLIQKRIDGHEFCSYTVAYEGKIRAMTLYDIKYRLHQSSGVYFERIRNEAAETFIRNFVEHFNYHGQVGFDFIEMMNGRVYVIECNPRTTSGMHLMERQPELAASFFPGDSFVVPADEAPACMKPVMWTYIMPRMLLKGKWPTFRKDLDRAQDITYRENDPLPRKKTYLGLSEALWRWAKRGGPFKEACTYDIEWDG